MMVEMSYIFLSNKAATNNVWLLGIWHVASATRNWIFMFHLILIKLNVNCNLWLVASVFDNTALNDWNEL